MPTVLQIGRFRFFFDSNEGEEPAHMHIRAGGDEAKFWLRPIGLEANHGFRTRELKEIENLVTENCAMLMEAWDEYFA